MELGKKDHRRIVKRILVGVATVTLVIAGAWGANKLYSSGVFSPVDTQASTSVTVASTTTAPPTVTPTSTPTPTPTPTPSPTPTPIPTPEQLEDARLKSNMVMAPDITGAVKVIRERNGLNRVCYERNGVYIGEFKQEVTFEGKETFNGDKRIGMVMLTAAEAKKISSEGDFFLPFDGSDLKSLSNVNLEINSAPLSTNPSTIRISFDSNEEVDLVNVIPGNNIFMMGVTPKLQSFSHIYTETNRNSKEIISGQEDKFIVMIGESSASDPFVGHGKSFAMGESFFKTSKPIYITLVVFYGTVSPTPSFDDIKSINGNPISITNNS